MFATDKPLPAPPAPAKPRNISLAAQLPSYRSRPSPSGARTSNAFHTAQALFNVSQKPEVQKTALSASKNPVVRSAAISAAKNKQVQSTALSAAENERARHTIAELAKMYDSKVAKNVSNSYGYGASTTKDFKKPSNTASFLSNAPAKQQLSPKLSTPSTPSLYPSLGVQKVFSDDSFSSSSSDRQPERPQPTNFADIYHQLESLDLYKQSPKKQPPARPPPPKLQANRCSSSPSSTLTNEPHAIVKYPYNSAHRDELTCQPNDIVILKKEVDEQWIYALNTRTGQTGIVPIVFLNVKIPLVPTQKTDLVSSAVSSYEKKDAYVKALYDFDSGVIGDLKFTAGDIIRVTDKVSDEWYRGIVGCHSGIFPINFVEVIRGSLPPGPMGNTKASLISKPEFSGPQQTVLPDWGSSSPVASPKSVDTVVAAYDYNSGIPDDLVFKAGDVIEVIERVNAEWIRGRLRGATGLVPYTYISN